MGAPTPTVAMVTATQTKCRESDPPARRRSPLGRLIMPQPLGPPKISLEQIWPLRMFRQVCPTTTMSPWSATAPSPLHRPMEGNRPTGLRVQGAEIGSCRPSMLSKPAAMSKLCPGLPSSVCQWSWTDSTYNPLSNPACLRGPVLPEMLAPWLNTSASSKSFTRGSRC